MMPVKVENFAALANLRFSNTDNQGREFGVLIVKAAFDLAAGGSFVLSEDQEPLVLTDEFHGALNVSALHYPSDLVPFKPKTDVIFDIVARSPDGIPRKSWICRVEVEDQSGVRVEKAVRITGPRYWLPKWRRALGPDERRNWQKYRNLFVEWELSEPEPIRELPVRYEYAYGGLMPAGQDENGRAIVKAYEYNPIGRGWIDKDWSDHTTPIAAPQIEAIESPLVDPYEHYAPQGLGPIPPAWLPRRPLGGTYDQNWLDNVWPKWPKDYDFEYHNSSSHGLRGAEGDYMDGTITCRIVNEVEGGARTHTVLRIPDPTVLISESNEVEERQIRRLNLDTIFFDLGDPEQRNWRALVSGRAVFKHGVDLSINIKRKLEWMVLENDLLKRTFLPSPHPAEIV